MDVRGILRQLRRGERPTDEEIADFAKGLGTGQVTDAQGAAFAMAICLGGLDEAGTVALTRAMRDSGEVLHWDLPGPVLDKHSTGGLGDATSLIVAPILAALGAYAPFLSGRGLGHTGGTLDKLEAVPGVATEVSGDALRRILADAGCAVVGATGDIAPADKRLYALRDHTGTVESIPLIVSSILSKKLAGGADALILDVKGGSGAFMQSWEEAEALARALVDTANGAGCATRALLTDMNQPLASSVGNAVEMTEVVTGLTDPHAEGRLISLSIQLSGEVLNLCGMAGSVEAGCEIAEEALRSGRAAERFARMIHALGGPADLLERPDAFLPAAPVTIDVIAGRAGNVAAIDGVRLGEAVVAMGGGRRKPGDAIDPRVGLSHVMSLGDAVEADTPLARIHAADRSMAEAAAEEVRRAIRVADAAAVPPLIHGRIE